MKTTGREVKTGRLGQPKPDLPVITLLTDFGTVDYFVGAVKGVILSVNPRALIVDITHDIPAQDIAAAAFTLFAAYQSFPTGTIHVAVVDPGVGSARRAVILRTGKYLFVGPDNGIFSYVCDTESQWEVFQITNESYFRRPLSSTFHGRDVFAPVAAALSAGVKPGELGPRIDDPIRLPPLAVSDEGGDKIEGRIIHIDRFGNCITNLTPENLSPAQEQTASLRINGKRIRSIRDHYSAEDRKDKLFGVWGSAGFLEVAAKNKSAAKILGAKRGDIVQMLRRRHQK